jgi:hypothetical protein
MVAGPRSWKWGSAVTFGGAAPDERTIFRWEIEDIEAKVWEEYTKNSAAWIELNL